MAATFGIARSLDVNTSKTDIKTAAGYLCGVWVTNRTANTIWLRFYNATAANVVVGTTVPRITIGIPGNSTDAISANLNVGKQDGMWFDTAMSMAATTGFADNDTGAPAANSLIVNAFYR